jgi:hypothetical protein
MLLQVSPKADESHESHRTAVYANKVSQTSNLNQVPIV